jgi:hypothetical protein
VSPDHQIICDTCLRTEPAGASQEAGNPCGYCGGTWLGPYAVARRFDRTEAKIVRNAEFYLEVGETSEASEP